MIIKRFFLVFFIFKIYALDLDYFFKIDSFKKNDPVYSQYLHNIKEYNKFITNRIDYLPPLQIYYYKQSKKESLFKVAAKLETIGKDGLLSINRLISLEDFKNREYILFASLPGVFVYSSPRSDLERLLYNRFKDDFDKSIKIELGYEKEDTVYFFFNTKINLKEFLTLKQDTKFIYPVDTPYYTITSHFGYRTNPFNAKNREFHSGIDLAYKIGTGIIASYNGTVSNINYNSIYGNNLTIKHNGGVETIYSHLLDNSIMVNIGDNVQRGQKIALMGSTGRSTGSHLDFRMKVKGKYIDPIPYLSK